MAAKDYAIRAWIDYSKGEQSFRSLRTLGVRGADIILRCNKKNGAIWQIGAYTSGKIGDSDQVERVSLHEFNIGRFEVDSEESKLLRHSDWLTVRSGILDENPELKGFISKLESDQLRSRQTLGTPAILFDALHTSIGLFQPKNREVILETLREVRDETTPSDDVGRLFEAFSDALRSKDLASPPSRPGIQYSLEKIDEQDVIYNDFYTSELIFRDTSTERELLLRMAHRKGRSNKGSSNADLAAADLIYDFTEHRSLVFVQYKRYSETGTLSVRSAEFRSQLDTLLATCKVQDPCPNCANETGYKPSSEIRLNDCCVYYKLIDHIPKIPIGKSLTPGTYIQACLVHQLSEELQRPLKKEEDTGRGLALEVFADLLRQGNIGSKPSAYEQLQRRIDEHKSGEFVLFAKEIKSP
jgi:hypothetical protein